MVSIFYSKYIKRYFIQYRISQITSDFKQGLKHIKGELYLTSLSKSLSLITVSDQTNHANMDFYHY